MEIQAREVLPENSTRSFEGMSVGSCRSLSNSFVLSFV